MEFILYMYLNNFIFCLLEHVRVFYIFIKVFFFIQLNLKEKKITICLGRQLTSVQLIGPLWILTLSLVEKCIGKKSWPISIKNRPIVQIQTVKLRCTLSRLYTTQIPCHPLYTTQMLCHPKLFLEKLLTIVIRIAQFDMLW